MSEMVYFLVGLAYLFIGTFISTLLGRWLDWEKDIAYITAAIIWPAFLITLGVIAFIYIPYSLACKFFEFIENRSNRKES